MNMVFVYGDKNGMRDSLAEEMKHVKKEDLDGGQNRSMIYD